MSVSCHVQSDGVKAALRIAQGAVKAALGRLRERYAGRARQLAEERFSLAAALEHAEEARTERAEDIANMRYKARHVLAALRYLCPVSTSRHLLPLRNLNLSLIR